MAPFLVRNTNLPRKNDLALTPAKKLPAPILNRPKTGFATPISKWYSRINSGYTGERGLRAWAHYVGKEFNIT